MRLGFDDGHLGLLAAMALLAAFACGCGHQDGVDSGGPLASERGRIAFTRTTTQHGANIESDVYKVDVDGTGEVRLTDAPGLDGMSSWSPDGRRIAFVSDRDGNWEIYVMAPDDTKQRRLTNTPEDEGSPVWSPDGKKIAYLVDPFGDPTIWVMKADGSGSRQLARASWPSWSPDGKRIVYTVYSDTGEGRLYVMNAEGSDQHAIPAASLIERLSGNADGEEPAWSPAGKRIAFAATAGKDNEEIYVVNSDGSRRTRLTDIPGYDHWPPTWSPDGTRIAFTSEGTKNDSEIYVMNSDGSGLSRLTDAPADDAFPAWRP
ncbi:MAG: PD40 domain-containing protein [Rubrobacteraceae bacterium]|nr:PD40 domain-containing protein [Rubrobacteraceae bacterium]